MKESSYVAGALIIRSGGQALTRKVAKAFKHFSCADVLSCADALSCFFFLALAVTGHAEQYISYTV